MKELLQEKNPVGKTDGNDVVSLFVCRSIMHLQSKEFSMCPKSLSICRLRWFL